MARILTGIQSTGTPHLGNILGAIVPAIEMANDLNNDSFLLIANMHTLTQIKDAAVTSLMFGTDLEYQSHQSVASYVNGDYWGIYKIREKVNEHFLLRKQIYLLVI